MACLARERILCAVRAMHKLCTGPYPSCIVEPPRDKPTPPLQLTCFSSRPSLFVSRAMLQDKGRLPSCDHTYLPTYLPTLLDLLIESAAFWACAFHYVMSQPVQSRATNKIVQATRIFSHYKNEHRIVRILMRNFNTILLKYQIEWINDHKSSVCWFDPCDPSFKLPKLVQLK